MLLAEILRVFERWATLAFLSSVMVLLLLGFARMYSITQGLAHDQEQACLLRREGRADTNLHDRVPLRAALQYLGDAVAKSAAGQTDPRKRREALRFAHQFQAYAAQVKPLENPQC